MDYRATASVKKPESDTQAPSRQAMALELKRQANILRDEGKTAAEFWLADQYEKTANLLN
ncbi:hypothetical protein [Neptuniibacter halophilus]|uniref:hypothetical protein n=1 Tax=Neptuniibacter halophilus TaxID=651666 RepID=UPI00257241CE|nr:hypothetical protein [Neptuniibacter halophilus]